MVVLKTSRELKAMREAGRISANALKLAGEAVEPGITTWEIDEIVRKYIEGQGAVPSFLGYGGFPASACISVNNVVIHGIPSKKCVVKKGDIVSIDIGAHFNGFQRRQRLDVPLRGHQRGSQGPFGCHQGKAFFEGIKMAKAGNRIGDIGSAVQRYVEARNYSVVRDFVGHGVGAKLHEDPSVPNFGTPGRGVRLLPGMTIAIEPMVNAGTYEVEILSDEWTTVTADGKLSAHFEHSVAITPDGPQILTLPDD